MIAVICDATFQAGYGHLRRCLVLADRFGEMGFSVTFFMEKLSASVKGILDKREVSIMVQAGRKALLSRVLEKAGEIDLLIIDHYGIDAECEKKVFRKVPLLVLDDLLRCHFCDILADQTLNREKADYEGRVNSDAVILAGADYVLLNPAYTGVQNSRDIKNILVSFGATDPEGHGLKAAEFFEGVPDAEKITLHFPLSSMSGSLDALRAYQKTSNLNICIYEDPEVRDMKLLYSCCGVAVGAAGTSVLERIYCGLINIIFTVADNQTDVAAALAGAGAVVHPGRISEIDLEAFNRAYKEITCNQAVRDRMREQGYKLVDGKGYRRILKAAAPVMGEVELRAAGPGDRDLLYRWQKEPGARRYSGNPQAPDYQTHCKWFESIMADKKALVLMIVWCGKKVGYVRLEKKRCSGKEEQNEEEVSILVSRPFQCMGLAGQSLARIVSGGNRRYKAFVQSENAASAALFQSAGFSYQGGGLYIYDSSGRDGIEPARGRES